MGDDSWSLIDRISAAEMEALFSRYRANPESLPSEWRFFFQGFDLGSEGSDPPLSPSIGPSSRKISSGTIVESLLDYYHRNGHRFAQTDPLNRHPSPSVDRSVFGLDEGTLRGPLDSPIKGIQTLESLISFLDDRYTGKIGFEIEHVEDEEQRQWLFSKIDPPDGPLWKAFDSEERRRILRDVIAATGLEEFLQQKFPGQKRFSLEGGESLVPALKRLIMHGASLGIEEFVFGMAHRGRLSILSNVLGKSYNNIFLHVLEKNNLPLDDIIGDVIYHDGHAGSCLTESGKEIKLTMISNPSHLEAVNPVVCGVVRAKIEQRYNANRSSICPILIHGDAALSGQGVVYETIQMSSIQGFEVGGTVHVAINNQIGFTTNVEDARSSPYCTDVAHVCRAPVFHVNGDDPESVIRAFLLAIEFRQQFHKDVFIDLVCYRRRGHNETDEPSFTQRQMYETIRKHDKPCDVYARELCESGCTDEARIAEEKKAFLTDIEESLSSAQRAPASLQNLPDSPSKDAVHTLVSAGDGETGVSLESLKKLSSMIFKLPSGRSFLPKIQKLFALRESSVQNDKPIDWGTAELLSYASLVSDGVHIRLTGQDVQRGTFSHRHAFVKDQEDQAYCPLQTIPGHEKDFHAHNSLLSEFAVLGFEYGYSCYASSNLSIWEAQFGDFANGAQIIIDNFISSSEAKWGITCPLVLMLPHGPEGQGPEHSSARLERFLGLCGGRSLRVVVPTTPANLFHILRAQASLGDTRVPLILLTPKSGLRSPEWVSTLSDLSDGSFLPLIVDGVPQKARHLVFCSGKIYYSLRRHRDQHKMDHIALIRLEQLYPFPALEITQVLQSFSKVEKCVWAQEEPENMGAWPYVSRMMQPIRIFDDVVSSSPSSVPSPGLNRFYRAQQERIIEKLFADLAHRPHPKKKAAEASSSLAKSS